MRPLPHQAGDGVSVEAEAEGGHFRARRDSPLQKPTPVVHGGCTGGKHGGDHRRRVQVLERGIVWPFPNLPEKTPLWIRSGDVAWSVLHGHCERRFARRMQRTV